MNLFRLFPVFCSFLLIGAHFQRAGDILTAICCLLAPCLLYFNRPWSVRIVQTLLLLSTVEWLITLLQLVDIRQDSGLPWTRLAIILSLVALFTCASAVVFRSQALRKRYGL